MGMMSYETGDGVAKGLHLPAGVSITPVAGQPGMLTISNNPVPPMPHHMMARPQMGMAAMAASPPMGAMANMYGMPGMNAMSSMTGLPSMPHMTGMFPGAGMPGGVGSDMLMNPGVDIMANTRWNSTDQTIVIDGAKKQDQATLLKKHNNLDGTANNKNKKTNHNDQLNSRNSKDSSGGGNINGSKNKKGNQKNAKAAPAVEASRLESESGGTLVVLDKRMTADERIQAALNGLIDPDRLSTKQRSKYNRLLGEDFYPLAVPASDSKKRPIACVTTATSLVNAGESSVGSSSLLKASAGNDKKKTRGERKLSEVSNLSDDEPCDDESGLMDQLYDLSIGKKTHGNLLVAGMAISCRRDDKSGSASRDASIKGGSGPGSVVDIGNKKSDTDDAALIAESKPQPAGSHRQEETDFG